MVGNNERSMDWVGTNIHDHGMHGPHAARCHKKSSGGFQVYNR